MKPNKLLKNFKSSSRWLPIILRDRNYHLSKEFGKWETIATELALCMDCYQLGKTELDLASQLTAHRTCLWFLTDSPIYCINSDLLRDLLETDVDKLSAIASLSDTVPLHTLMLVFPHWFKSPDGHSVRYAILHWGDRNNPEQSIASGYGLSLPYWPQEYEINIHLCFSCNLGQIIWFSGTGLEDGELKINKDFAIGNLAINQQEMEFIDQMRSLAIQTFLLLAYKPELLDNQSLSSNNGFGNVSRKQNQKQNQKRYPRMLGKSYERKYQSVGTGSGIKQRSHVRRGHWREVACGTGRKQRKLKWIQPYWVGL